MFRRLGWLVSQRSWSTRRLLNVEQSDPPTTRANQLLMLDAIHEVAIYVHRFHNLDLFDKGWFKIKITMRWENDVGSYSGIPARVVQYEEFGGLMTQTIVFQLLLFVSNMQDRMCIFLSWSHSTYLFVDMRPDLHSSLDRSPTAVHEYRIPPKALLGLHSYCPIYFDSLHAVLVDTTVHISLLRAGFHTPRLKVPSDSLASEGTRGEDSNLANKAMLIKAFIAAHDILLEDLRRLSKGIGQAIDWNEITSKLDSLGSTPPADVEIKDGEVLQQISNRHQGSDEIDGGSQPVPLDYRSDSFQSLGNQLLYLWNKFLIFHRENKMKIMEFLRNSWANDRRAEWSIWMVYSRVEMPHRYLSNRADRTSLHGSLLGRSLSLRRSRDEPVQTASMRAELHRRGIAHMRINNRSLQDMYLFGDPLCVPIIIVERMTNMQRSTSVNSYFNPFEEKTKYTLENGSRATIKLSACPRQEDHVLRVVVFVHGFQGNHLDLRLVRNQWLLIDPNVQFLMSVSNEDRTTGDLGEMGSRLAQEVIAFIEKKMNKASKSGKLKAIKLSFVGHSIGNLIIRTALADKVMEPYQRSLHTYVSMSGPHLGYMYSSNSIFNSGLWLLKKLNGTQCIHQLTFTDDSDLENTFIYNLSKKKTLAHFRNVILLSSPQDGYVPYHSARIEHCSAAFLDYSKKGKIFLEMLNNCLDQIRAPSENRVVMRCDINFNTSSYGRNLSSLIGRAAHIEFLESDIFAKFIMWSFPDMFL